MCVSPFTVPISTTSGIYRTEWPNAPGIWSDQQVQGWKKITDAVHGAGAKMYCQVNAVPI